LSQCIRLRVTRSADDTCWTGIDNQNRCSTSKGRRGDQNTVVPGRPAPGGPKGVGLSMQASVDYCTGGSRPAPSKLPLMGRSLRPRNAASAKPMRACSNATANMPCAIQVDQPRVHAAPNMHGVVGNGPSLPRGEHSSYTNVMRTWRRPPASSSQNV